MNEEIKEEKTYITHVRNVSFNFLYPLVGFIQNTRYKPSWTYLYWKDENIDDYKLITHYKEDINDPDFKSFEKGEIFKNEKVKDKLANCYNVEDGMVYIFDLVSYAADIGRFLEGKYSHFSKETKAKICDYFRIPKEDGTPERGSPIHMALYPEIYFDAVAKELGVSSKYLRNDVGELCRKYDIEEETAYFEIVENCNCSKATQISLDLK